MHLYSQYTKRLVDVVIAVVLLALLFPVLAIVAALIAADSAGPVIFSQTRVGRDARIFRLHKFRTMTDVRRTVSVEIYDGAHAEVTRVGAWLRRFKIDELPQLWNVLRGEMSLVGPRPCMPEQLATLNVDGRMRLRVRPGLTGLAQVNGNIFLSWPQRWVFDRDYVENLSFRMDIGILRRTLRVVIFGERARNG
jgi:undecaprenyl phosphate N,N'-diacetylbacillosamine 1-phosphate transferase